MFSRRRAVAALSVLALLLAIGCGGRTPLVRGAGQIVYATAGGPSTSGSVGTGSTSTSAGTTSGDTTATTSGVATAGGFPSDPPLADAALDLTIASASGTPPFATMAGTGDAMGDVYHSYSYDEASGEGFFDTYADLDGDGTGYQRLSLFLGHETFVAVGTKMTIGGDAGTASYFAFTAYPGTFYDATSGTAEVTALGPGQSVTLKLTDVVFHSEDPDLPDLTFNGTIRSSASPEYASTSGESTAGSGVTGGSGGYDGTTSG